jgi:hypothetical protein
MHIHEYTHIPTLAHSLTDCLSLSLSYSHAHVRVWNGRDALAASPMYGVWAMPFLLDKLSADRPQAKAGHALSLSHTHTTTQVHTDTHRHTCTEEVGHRRTHLLIHTGTQTHTHTYAHTCTYTHTCTYRDTVLLTHHDARRMCWRCCVWLRLCMGRPPSFLIWATCATPSTLRHVAWPQRRAACLYVCCRCACAL